MLLLRYEIQGEKMKAKKKFYTPDAGFYFNIREACNTLMELGTVVILQYTGMHRQSLSELEPGDLVKEGNMHLLYWYAPKKRRKVRALRAHIPDEDVETVRAWLNRHSGKHPDTYYKTIIGLRNRSGYPQLAPMSFRSQRIVLLMRKYKGDVRTVSLLTGARFSTIEDHYAQASIEEQPLDVHDN
jgi:hypothetical protein